MRIVLLHDIFRSTVFGLGGLNRVPAFWQGLLAPAFASLGCELLRPTVFAEDRPALLTALVEREGFAPDRTSWFRLYSTPAEVPRIAAMLTPLRGIDLVLGWELTPNIIRALQELNVRFIDASIDSIRFCPDLFVRLRSNDAALATRLAALAIGEAVVPAEAARLAAYIAQPADQPRSVLFAGQMEFDASLVVDAALSSVASHLPEVAAAADGLPLLLKPHPHASTHADIRLLHALVGNSRIVTDHIYALLTAPEITRVVTLSSSVADEAEMFGKPATRLIVPDNAPQRLPEVSPYCRVDAGFMTAAFWGSVLDRAVPAGAVATPPRTIRSIFSYNWGWTNAPRRRLTTLTGNTQVSFAAGGNGETLCGFGWSKPESWGVWSDGGRATLLFDTPPNQGDFLLRLYCIAFVPDPTHPPRVAISMRPAGERYSLTVPNTHLSPIELRIPARGARGGGPLEVVFEFVGLISPAAAGVSDDTRLLGLGLRHAETCHLDSSLVARSAGGV